MVAGWLCWPGGATENHTILRTVDKELVSRTSDWAITLDSAFPNEANYLGTLFGGRVLELMDINASIAAVRFCRTPSVTASTEPIDFHNPIHVGEVIEVKSRVVYTGTTSMIIRSEVRSENPITGERKLCTIGHLSFVAIGEDGRPTPVPQLAIRNEAEQEMWEIGKQVKAAALERTKLTASKE